jgi:hypothetical protein
LTLARALRTTLDIPGEPGFNAAAGMASFDMNLWRDLICRVQKMERFGARFVTLELFDL